MIKVIHDIVTDTYTEIELTKEELAIRQSESAKLKAEQAERDAEQAIKDAARQVILDKLGLTQEEASLLLS